MESLTQGKYMPLKIFIDTEFTDFTDPHLISIGMASISGEEFYAEVAYPDEKCSVFVREIVIPLLGRIPDAQCLAVQLGDNILDWLDKVRRNQDVEICFDFETDWDLFSNAIARPIPAWCAPRLISARNINELLRYAFHKKKNLPEHHALYDAMATRYAFRERS